MAILVSATQAEPTRLTALLRRSFPAPGAVEQIQTVTLRATGDCAVLAGVLNGNFLPVGGGEFSAAAAAPDWIVLTSPGGISVVFGELRRLGFTPAQARHLRYAVVGDATADALREQGLEPTYISGHASPPAADSGRTPESAAVGGAAAAGARALAEGLASSGLIAGAVVHVLQSNRADSSVWAPLQARAARLRRWVAYRSDLMPENSSPLAAGAAAGAFSALAFTSGSTVEGLLAVVGTARVAALTGWLKRAQVFSLGPTATKTLAALGVTGVLEPSEATVPALAALMQAKLKA
ncbi:MAG: uroporphyrinogen-III synthase [Planctomycetota bacterium]